MSQVDTHTGEEVTDEPREIEGGGTLATISRAEIDMQISTAKRYPRSLTVAKRQMIEMATLTKDIAKSCNYALKRTDKNGKIVWIEGPSIRMAEIAVACWGNLRYGARIVDEDGRFITAQGVCHDLEKNVYVTMEVRRRITDRNGRTYKDDMIGMTGNAAAAIAARNAVFKVIPRAIILEAAEFASKVAMGEGKEFGTLREQIVAHFTKLGVKIGDIMRILEKPNGGIEDIDSTGLRRLLGIKTSIEDGDATLDQVFGPSDENAAPKGSAEVLNKIKNDKQPNQAKESPAPEKSDPPKEAPKTTNAEPSATQDASTDAKTTEATSEATSEPQMTEEEKAEAELKELYEEGPGTYQKAMAEQAAKVNPKITAKIIKQAIVARIGVNGHGTNFAEFKEYWEKAKAGQIDVLAGKFQ